MIDWFRRSVPNWRVAGYVIGALIILAFPATVLADNGEAAADLAAAAAAAGAAAVGAAFGRRRQPPPPPPTQQTAYDPGGMTSRS
jgi:hypothetical protein